MNAFTAHLPFLPKGAARTDESIPQREYWTMADKKDLWYTKWASIAAVIMIPIGGIWVAAHKDQQLDDVHQSTIEIRSEMKNLDAKMADRLNELQRVIDKILTKSNLGS